MGVLWYKVWFDLWHNKLRTLLVILSITVGVFSVGATFGMAELMLPTMDAAHMSTAPSHGTMALDQPVDRETLLALRRIPGVEDIEPLNSIEVRYKIRPEDEWKKANILARDQYAAQVYDLTQLVAGHWPEGRLLGIERMHSPWYGLDIGDEVIIEVDGQPRSFEFSGKIRHPFVPPPSMYDLAFFFSGEEVMEMFGIPLGTFTQFKFAATEYSDENARRVASALKERLANQGIGVTMTLYQDPAKHWGRAFIDGMTVVIEVLAVLSMLLSIVLVLNTLTALIAQQTNQIGILKAIGGTSSAVIKVYLAGVGFYGALALLIALPLGTLTAFSISKMFLELYNIDYAHFEYSPVAVALQVIAALAVPLAAALVPILGGAAITVREAIASYGLGGDFRTMWIDKVVERIGQRFLISYDAIAVSNTFRRKGRLALTQLVLVIAGVMFLMVMSLSTSITATMDAEFARREHDVIVTFERIQRVDRTVRITNSLAGVEHSGMWLIVPATILHQGQRTLDAGLGSQLQGVPVEDPMYRPMMVAGRWLEPGDDRVVVLNQDTADDEAIQVGDWITLDLGDLGQHEWQVVGLYRVFLMFGGGFNVDAIYAPREAVFAATKKAGRAGTLLVRTRQHSMDDCNRTASELSDLFDRHNIPVRAVETIPMLRQTSDVSFSYVIVMLMVLACIVALVGGIGLMGSLWIGVIERTKEIGILRAVGAVSPLIVRMFLLEGLLQGLMSWVMAVPLSLLVTPWMAEVLGQTMFNSSMEYSYNYAAVLTWLGVIVGLSSLASIIPARSATRINVRQSLNYE